MNLLDFIIGLMAGIFASIVGYAIIEWIKDKVLRKRQFLNETNYIINILLEIKRAIDRSEQYVDWAIDGKSSFSRIYTFSYEKSLVELIKINSNPRVVDRINYIYSILFFVNFNIDKDRYPRGIGFIKDHMLKIFDCYNDLIAEIDKRKQKNYDVKIPKEIIYISESRKDAFKEKIKKLEKNNLSFKKAKVIDTISIYTEEY
jgi:hypothetical protein